MPSHPSPIWQHTGSGLVLQVGQRRDPVPAPIDDWLTGPGGVGLSTDAARDLLRVERRLRHVITQLLEQVTHLDRRVAAYRTDAGSDDQRQRKRRRRVSREGRALQGVLSERTDLLETVEGARSLLQILRAFVIELDPPYGLLRAAADGWRRGPDPTASVVVFDSEEAFLDADPRRATPGGWGGPTVAGIERFGVGWRRDGDEDDPAQTSDKLTRAGPWQIGYIERTTEIYAIRRCGYLPRQVWLLGTGFDTLRTVRDLMLPIMPRMTEPNSVVLAAGTVQADRMWQESTGSQAGIPPG